MNEVQFLKEKMRFSSLGAQDKKFVSHCQIDGNVENKKDQIPIFHDEERKSPFSILLK